MTESGYALFDTAIGRCGIAWNERGIVATTLPEADERRARTRLLRRCPGAREGAPPPDVQRAIDGIVALLAGEAVDLSGVVLDMAGVPAFNARIYPLLRTGPPRQTLTHCQGAAPLRPRGGRPPRRRRRRPWRRHAQRRRHPRTAAAVARTAAGDPGRAPCTWRRRRRWRRRPPAIAGSRAQARRSRPPAPDCARPTA